MVVDHLPKPATPQQTFLTLGNSTETESIMQTTYNSATTLFNVQIETNRAAYLPWHKCEQDRHPMHPAIIKALNICAPDDYVELVMQWPYESDKHLGKLAYTRNATYGRADRQTVTTIGRYLRANFPLTLTDHQIRDIVALETAKGDTFKFINTMGGMLEALHRGPNSCMKSEDDELAFAEDHRYRTYHPYRTYDPMHGWHMAVRYDGIKVAGRALCNDSKFVRTYKRNEESTSYSTADEMLDAWLISQGYARASSWEGCKLEWIATNNERNVADFVAPYIDGQVQTVQDRGNFLVICDDGDWKCDNTDGTATQEAGCTCESCNQRVSPDDLYSVGYHGDQQLCESCVSDYVNAYGRNGSQYLMPMDECIYVERQNDWYVDRYAGSNGIVRTEHDDYQLKEDCVCIDGDWYLNDSDNIVYDYNNEPQLAENCTYSEERGAWYHDDDDLPVEEATA